MWKYQIICSDGFDFTLNFSNVRHSVNIICLILSWTPREGQIGDLLRSLESCEKFENSRREVCLLTPQILQ